jgi:hypothetical protein
VRKRGGMWVVVMEGMREGVKREVKEGLDKMLQEKMHRHTSIFRTGKQEYSRIDLCHKICPEMSEMSL